MPEPEPEDAYMPALGLSPIKEYVEGKSGMLTIPDPKKIFTRCLDMIGGEDAVVTSILNGTFQESVHQRYQSHTGVANTAVLLVQLYTGTSVLLV